MKRLILATALISACAVSPAAKFDQAHLAYNHIASVALSYAERPDADPVAKEAISQTVMRTAPVILRASTIIDDPEAQESERTLYVRWALAIVEQATLQLTDLVLGR